MSRFGEDRPRQLPLGFGQDGGFSLEDLVVTGSNRAAATLLTNWPDWPSPVVLLVGPAGSGKSHLAHVFRERSGAVFLERGAVSPPPGGELRAAVVENCDAGPIDEEGLFHLINAVRAAGGSLLLTARRAPSTWPIALPDLASRLRAATLVEIEPPDDELLAAVIFKLFADRQVEVDPQVVTFILARMQRSLDEAIRLVDRIDTLSLERKCRITRALAAEAMARHQP